MKTLLLVSICLVFIKAPAQIPAHLACKEPVKLSLWVKPPSPRENQHVEVVADFSVIVDSLNLAAKRQNPSLKIFPYNNEGTSLFSLDKLTVGKHEFGPFSFVLNDQPYTTDKLVIHVDDSLRHDEFGLWIRHVVTSDSTFCITIEQKEKRENKKNLNKWQFIMEDTLYDPVNVYVLLESNDFDKIEYAYTTNGNSLEELPDDKEKIFYQNYSSYTCFIKKPGSGEFILTRNHFKNLPKDFDFKPIRIP